MLLFYGEFVNGGGLKGDTSRLEAEGEAGVMGRIRVELGFQSDAAALVEGMTLCVRERLSELDSIAIPGFGTFEAKKKDERIVNNPSNGKRMLVPPRVAVGFKVSNVLKSKLK